MTGSSMPCFNRDSGRPSASDGHELEDLHWGVKSAIPKKQGLKSSAATCIAALRALGDATDVHPSTTSWWPWLLRHKWPRAFH